MNPLLSMRRRLFKAQLMPFTRETFIYFQLLQILISVGQNTSVKVGFQLDGRPTKDSFLKYKGQIPDLSELAVCFRVEIKQFRSDIPLLSYAVEGFDNELVITYDVLSEVIRVTYSSPPSSFKVNQRFPIDEEISACITVNNQNRSYTGTINERFVQGKIISNTDVGDVKIRGNGYLYLGQEQDRPNGGFQIDDSFCGILYSFSLYKRLLNFTEMIRFTSCSSDGVLPEDNVLVSLHNMTYNFEISNVNITEYDDELSKCVRDRSFYTLFSGERNFYESSLLCQAVGGELVVPKSEQENLDFFNFINKNKMKCSYPNTDLTWVGVYGNESGGYYEHYKTGEKLIYDNIRDDFPANLAVEKCMTFYGSEDDLERWHGMWSPSKCLSSVCASCYFHSSSVLNLRGLCQKSIFDRKYVLQTNNESDYFKGYFYSFIKFIEPVANNPDDKGRWKIFRLDMPESSATLSVKTKTEYPFGKKLWDVTGDVCGSSELYLMLTACNETQFSCNDGSCISSAKRCDLEVDCKDTSDELDCLPLVLPQKYSKHITPPLGDKNELLEIDFFLDIFSVRSFDLEGFKFTAEMMLSLLWNDSRIQFKNLKFEQMNVIEYGRKKMPWIPRYVFMGDQNSTSEIHKLIYSLTARRLSKPLPDNDEFVAKDELFRGSENNLILRHKFLLTTSCQFDLTFFPFDSQICNLYIILGEGYKTSEVLVPIGKGVTFSGKRRLLQYMVKSVGYFKEICVDAECDVIKIQFDSLSSFYITNTYIPTFIMLVIGYLPLFFIMADFNDRITVSVTSLLVEATFLSQLTLTAPITAYMKMIDIWCLFCIVVLFSATILQTAIHYLNRNAEEKTIHFAPSQKENALINISEQRPKAERLNLLGTIIYPIIVGIFTLTYVIIATNQIGQVLLEENE